MRAKTHKPGCERRADSKSSCIPCLQDAVETLTAALAIVQADYDALESVLA